MNYTIKDVRIGGMEKKVLVVTADRALRREEIGDVGSIVDGYCGAFPRDGWVETWFFYADDKDLLVKNWIAANTSDARITNLEEAVLDDVPTDDRGRKLLEVGRACTKVIYAGVEVETGEGVKHFSLEQHDQTELMGLGPGLDALIAAGDLTTPAIPYHADGELCRLWNAADFGAILQTATAHIFYHRTYCNHLNAWIRREEDEAVLLAITYGDPLPEDLAQAMAVILAASGG